MEYPAKHPGHVGIDRRDLALESKTRDRRGGVPPDSRQKAQLAGVRGNDAASVLDDFLGQPVQVDRPSIVAQTLPALAHGSRRG